MANKKLIEVALPLEKINEESAREKSIRKGHPSTLHLWWARRPLATARAVIWASLVDDPSSHPDLFPTEESQDKERQRLFKILEDLVVWENSTNETVLSAAKAEIIKSTNGNIPAFLDPFAGGGAIPLEAQRLGLKSYANDLNPVAVMINKAMIEIPPRFAGKIPVNADSKLQIDGMWPGTSGLVSDIQYYGEYLKNEAYKRIGFLYPKIKTPKEYGLGEVNVISWICARTVQCPNPTCKSKMPLMNSFWLLKKKGREQYLEPVIDGTDIHFKVIKGNPPKDREIQVSVGTKYLNDKGKGKHATFCCPFCGNGVVTGDYADSEAENGRMGMMPVAVVAEGKREQLFFSIDPETAPDMTEEINKYYEAHGIDEKVPHATCRGTFASNAQGRYYGIHEFKDYFTKRQLITLTTFCDIAKELQTKIEADAVAAGYANDHVSLQNGGCGAKAYGEAVSVYLSFAIDRQTDLLSSMSTWINSIGAIRNSFARQGIAMSWDFAEVNPFSSSAGCFDNMLGWVANCLGMLPAEGEGVVQQKNAQEDAGLRNIMVSTDPPYYDNICYSDLSDYFYVWMREVLGNTYPDLFKTLLVPKADELIVNPYRFDGDSAKAKDFFEDGMLAACKQLRKYTSDEIPITIYYAYKQSETEKSDNATYASSSGWETMLSAIINAGLTITGTWPVRTEREVRTVATNANALACSIVLVCRKRPENAPQTTRRNLVNALRRELRPALKKLQDSNIAPVDLAQSAIGPGMGVFSCYRRVLEADGSPMTVRSALQIINEEVDLYFNDQIGNMDSASRFCVDLYTQYAYNNVKYGEAEVLANAKGTSIPMMVSHGVLYAKAGTVHLIDRSELPDKVDSHVDNIWMLTQQLTHAMATGGVEACAKIVYSMFGSNAERAKDLAYRLYTIAEQKKWTTEAYAYNALVVAWPDIQSRAAAMKAVQPEQITLFDVGMGSN